LDASERIGSDKREEKIVNLPELSRVTNPCRDNCLTASTVAQSAKHLRLCSDVDAEAQLFVSSTKSVIETRDGDAILSAVDMTATARLKVAGQTIESPKQRQGIQLPEWHRQGHDAFEGLRAPELRADAASRSH
jgi:hypothetical protein